MPRYPYHMENSKSVYEIFESNTCGRCSGKKVFACWARIANGVCFGCNGAGYKFTKHGQANYNAWRAAVDAITVKPVTDVKPGDAVKLDDFRKYYRVVSVTEPVESGWSESNGVRTPMFSVTLTFSKKITTSVGGLIPCTSDSFGLSVGIPVRIYPADGILPKAEQFVTIKKTRKARVSPVAA